MSQQTSASATSIERTLNEAQRLLNRQFEEPHFAGYQALRMNFSDRLWILVTRPRHETLEFKLESGVTAGDFVAAVLRSIAEGADSTLAGER